MTIDERTKIEKGKIVGDRICEKFGIQTKRIENSNDLFARNLTMTLNPSKKKIVVK